MREIKFRYWNGEEMSEFRLGEDWYYMPKDLHVMQYTGLKDKNGVAIYEGDVVKVNNEYDNGYRSGGSIENYQVAWQETQCRFCVTRGGEYDFWHSIADVQPGQIEVIGNIYEHSDLLK